MAKTKDMKPYVPKGEVVSFYGGKVQIEKKPWGESFRYIKIETGVGGILSATACTGKLNKPALIKWAVDLSADHMIAHFSQACAENPKTFALEEIIAVAEQARNKHEEKKTEGGEAGDIIHNYAHDFAKAVIAKKPLPTFDHLDEKNTVENRALNGINAFLSWYNLHHVEFLAMEELVYYNSYLAGDTKAGEDIIEYLGIMDLLARIDGKIEVIDYKSSKGVYNDQRYQVSGYFNAHNSNALRDRKASGARIVNFSKDTGDLIEKAVPAEEVMKDYRAFIGLFMVATREKELDAEYRALQKTANNKE